MGVSKFSRLPKENFLIPLDKAPSFGYIRNRIILNLVMRECDTAI